MNDYDSQRMGDILRGIGYESCQGPEEADLIILNTCHIREKAAEKIYSELGRLRVLKQNRLPPPRFAVAGCVAQAEGEEVLRRNRDVDLVVGPQAYPQLPQLLERLDRERAPIVAVDFPAADKFALLDRVSTPYAAKANVSAFLTIQEGCDKFCTFCVVPYTRGAEFSRPIAGIEAEARRLVGTGARAITLLGQNVSAYRDPQARDGEGDLADLLARLATIPDLARLSYTTGHPADMDDRLIAAHSDIAILAPYLHLPVQSGSDAILRRMNRRHRAEDYLRLVERLRIARPDLALSSDFIVGFPGESDADFEATLDLVEAVGFAQAFSFRYSPRPGTPAADADDPVAAEIAAERLQRLQSLLERQRRAFNEAMIGRVLPVLFTGAGRRPGQSIGKSPFMQSVHVEEIIAPGTLADVEIITAAAHSLGGRMISPAQNMMATMQQELAQPSHNMISGGLI